MNYFDHNPTPEGLLGQVESAFNDERRHFAELGQQARIALELDDRKWAIKLLFTIRAQGLGGPLEPLHGQERE